MSSGQIISLMIFHGLLDWFLQDRETATRKSSSIKYLIPHLTLIYFGLLVWGIIFGGLGFDKSFLFAVANVILHGLIDWNLWKLYKVSVIKRFPKADEAFKYWEDSWFYDFIMFDQVLHGICYVVVFFKVR